MACPIARPTLLLLALFVQASCATAPSVDPSASGARAAVVTEENLLANERFWPYRVAIPEPYTPEGRGTPLRRDEVGVLIRVEPGGARIDFGVRGKYVVPISKTDLVDRANAIQRGESRKELPNFVQAVRTRMLDASSETGAPLPVTVTDRSPIFLCVFADPSSPDFPELVASLAPLRERAGLLTIFFPQGKHSDRRVAAQLRERGWPVAFLPDFLSEGYTRSLLDEGTATPALLLQTSEGRVLYGGPWNPDDRPALDRAVASLPGGATETSAR